MLSVIDSSFSSDLAMLSSLIVFSYFKIVWLVFDNLCSCDLMFSNGVHRDIVSKDGIRNGSMVG